MKLRGVFERYGVLSPPRWSVANLVPHARRWRPVICRRSCGRVADVANPGAHCPNLWAQKTTKTCRPRRQLSGPTGATQYTERAIVKTSPQCASPSLISYSDATRKISGKQRVSANLVAVKGVTRVFKSSDGKNDVRALTGSTSPSAPAEFSAVVGPWVVASQPLSKSSRKAPSRRRRSDTSLD